MMICKRYRKDNNGKYSSVDHLIGTHVISHKGGILSEIIEKINSRIAYLTGVMKVTNHHFYDTDTFFGTNLSVYISGGFAYIIGTLPLKNQWTGTNGGQYFIDTPVIISTDAFVYDKNLFISTDGTKKAATKIILDKSGKRLEVIITKQTGFESNDNYIPVNLTVPLRNFSAIN